MQAGLKAYVFSVLFWGQMLSEAHFHRSSLTSRWRVSTGDQIFPLHKTIGSGANGFAIPFSSNQGVETLPAENIAGAIIAIVDDFVHSKDRGTELGFTIERFETATFPIDENGAFEVAEATSTDITEMYGAVITEMFGADNIETPKVDTTYQRIISNADQDGDKLHQAAPSLHGRSCKKSIHMPGVSCNVYSTASCFESDIYGSESMLEQVNDNIENESSLDEDMYTAVTSSKVNTNALPDRKEFIQTRNVRDSLNIAQSSSEAMSIVLASAASAASAAAAAAAIAAKVSEDILLQENKRIISCPPIVSQTKRPKKSHFVEANRPKEYKLGARNNSQNGIVSPKDLIPAHHVLFRTSRRNYRTAALHAVLILLAAHSFKTYTAHMLHSGEGTGAMGWLRLGFAATALEATHLVCLARSPRLKAALTTAPAPSLESADYVFIANGRNMASSNLVYSRLWPWLTRHSKVLANVGNLVPILHRSNSTADANHTCMFYRNSKWEWHDVGTGTAVNVNSFTNGSIASERGHWHRVTPPCCKPLEWYASRTGHSESSAAAARVRYGENRIDLGAVSLLHLFGARLASPLALWQVVSCLLSIADGYGANSLSYLVMFGLTELNVAFQEYTRKRTLRRDLAADGDAHPCNQGSSSKRASVGRETVEHVLVWRSNDESTATLKANHEAMLSDIQATHNNGSWVATPMAHLVPGDLVALRAANYAQSRDVSAGWLPETRVVPADFLVLTGEATVDEATLTGEDVPQTKVAVASRPASALHNTGESNEGKFSQVHSSQLDIANTHRRHVLFAGTKLLSHSAGEASGTKGLPAGAGSACVCYVLRTGWDSTRGELVRLATRDKEGSDDEDDSSSGAGARGVASVRAESTKLLTFLLSVGVATAITVLVQPAADISSGPGDTSISSAAPASPAVASLVTVAASEFRTLTKRLLRASRVLMSVVPTDLDSASSLTFGRFARELKQKFGVVSNDDWRLPNAGRTTTVVFDKTGTLTVDRISFEGVRRPHDETAAGTKLQGASSATDVDGLALAVLAACHALVLDPEATANLNDPTVPGNDNTPQPLLGDSLEAAALHALGWQLDANKKDTVVPLSARRKTAAAAVRSDSMRNAPLRSITILKRYPFDAATRRMGVVTRVSYVTPGRAGVDTKKPKTSSQQGDEDEVWLLVKGAAEAVKPLLSTTRSDHNITTHDGNHLAWLDQEAATYAQAGARVLALAGRKLSLDDQARAKVLPSSNSSEAIDEEISLDELAFSSDGTGLALGGLALFRAEIREDAEGAVKALRAAGVGVVMLTGDAVGTAAQVGLHVGLGLPSTNTNFTSYSRNQFGVSKVEDSSSTKKGVERIVGGHLEETGLKETKEVKEEDNSNDSNTELEHLEEDDEDEESDAEDALLAALAYVDARLAGQNSNSSLLEQVREAATAADASDAVSKSRKIDRRSHQTNLPPQDATTSSTSSASHFPFDQNSEDTTTVNESADPRAVLELRPNATAAGALLGLGAAHPYNHNDVREDSKLHLRDDDKDLATTLWWHDLRSGAAVEPFTFTRLPELASHYLLCCGGPTLDRLLLPPSIGKPTRGDLQPDLRAALPYFSILTRATPNAKEKVILALQSFPPPTVPGSQRPHHGKGSKAEVLFCGDGGNDLGGLHVASTGVAVVAMPSTTPTSPIPSATGAVGGAGKKVSNDGSTVDTPTRGSGGGDGGGGVAGSSLAAVAPFAADASRRCVAGVAAVVGVGRCAQAHMVSGHASAAVDALLSAAALCELYHSHKRWGDRQLLCLQGFSAVLALVFANAAMPRTSSVGKGIVSVPTTEGTGSMQKEEGLGNRGGIKGEGSIELGPVPPLPSLFTRAAAVSVLGQAAIHVILMRMGAALGRNWDDAAAAQALLAATAMGADSASPLAPGAAPQPPMSALERVKSALKRPPFVPNHVANHLFLLNAAQAVAVPLTNFAGRPFALDVASSLPLLAATVGGVALTLALAAGVAPPLETLLQWAPLLHQPPPTSSLADGPYYPGGGQQAAQRTLLALGALALPWLWRRLTEEVFAPSLAQARAATPLSEASKQNLSKVTTGTIAAFALIVPAIHDLAAQSASS